MSKVLAVLLFPSLLFREEALLIEVASSFLFFCPLFLPFVVTFCPHCLRFLQEMEIKNKAQMQMAISEAEMLKDIMENVSHPNVMHIEKVFQVRCPSDLKLLPSGFSAADV